MRGALLIGLCALAVLASGTPAEAYWLAGGSGSGLGSAATMPTGNQPSVAVSNRSVTVTWTQNTFQGSPLGSYSGGGYTLKRYAQGSSTGVTPNAGCATRISGAGATLQCVETGVPVGNWQYSVRPVLNSFTGDEGPKSATATVAAPQLSFSSPTTITTLPTTLAGSISNFAAGQGVTFRLDDPATGTALSGSISPTPVPGSGSASVSVTIPAGTSNGAHTVYAVGSGGDTAGAAITVSVPVNRSLTTSAWNLRDLSSGTESDQSNYFAFAGDSRYQGPISAAYGFQPAFNSSKYLDFDLYSPLPSGLPVSGATFKFDYTGGSAQACFYFEVRRASTGAVLATHGSPATPVDCTTSPTSFKSTSTALPEITDSATANDLRIRVYETNSAGTVAAPGANYTDLATVSATVGLAPVTIYNKRYTDATSTPVGLNWALVSAGDSASYTSASGWDTAFSSAKYLKLTFPAYVPSDATGVSASFSHSYMSDTSSTTTCYWLELYSGTTLIGSRGSASSPRGCNSTTSFVTDALALPEVNTPARANNLVVRLYLRNSNTQSAKRKTRHDLAQTTISYTSP